MFLNKLKIVFVVALSLGSAALFADTVKCPQPAGEYTQLEQVLNQFVLNNGNPNWGDWCYEHINPEDEDLCLAELEQWNRWLECAGMGN